MLISILIPVYNVEPYVKRCLESVMAQKTEKVDIECLIIDDCGTDCSMKIVNEVIVSYQGPIQFHVIRHQQNRGVATARNTGLRAAKGDFFMFVDSDDYLMPNSIQYFVEALLLYPKTDVVIGNAKNIKEDKIYFPALKETVFIEDPDVLFREMITVIYHEPWNKLVRRSLLQSDNIFFIDGIVYEDELWAFRLFDSLSSAVILPNITYAYEYTPESIMNGELTLEKVNKRVYSLAKIVNSLLDKPHTAARYKTNFAVEYLMFMAHMMFVGVDLCLEQPVSSSTNHFLYKTRRRILLRSLRYGRMLIFCYLLLLYWPLTYLMRSRFYRKIYHRIDEMVRQYSHLTDFLHNKNRI